MKKIAIITALAVLILLLTRIANNVPPDPPRGASFSLKAQRVIGCTPNEITLLDLHQTQTHLEKDSSWPDCATFRPDDVLDFYLSRGEKTHFESTNETDWWRKVR